MGRVGELTMSWEPRSVLCHGGQDILLANSPAPPSTSQAGGNALGATAASHVSCAALIRGNQLE